VKVFLSVFGALILSVSSGLAGYLFAPSFPPTELKAIVSLKTETFDPALRPAYLTINSQRWMVVPFSPEGPKAKHEFGETDCSQRIIWYNPAQRTEENARNTMWHEIQHAYRVCSTASLDEDSAEVQTLKAIGQDNPAHREIQAKADFLTNFVHDNPEFMKWAEEWK
jgi:hypothetical protein